MGGEDVLWERLCMRNMSAIICVECHSGSCAPFPHSSSIHVTTAVMMRIDQQQKQPLLEMMLLLSVILIFPSMI